MFGHSDRLVSLAFAIAIVANLLFQSFAPSATLAQSPGAATDSAIEDLLRQVDDLKNELHYLRERDAERQTWEATMIKRLPQNGAALEFASLHSSMGPEKTPYDSPAQVSQKSKCSCGCYSCECPLAEAPCIECPRVSTLSPYANVHIFGAFVGDMLFNEARPVSPGAPYYLSPSSSSGLTQDTLDIHARSSFLGAAVTGPQIGHFQAGGMAMVYFYNDNVIADQYGILPVQVWGDLKNEDWRFAAGLQFDVFNPNSPTMLAFGVLCGSGNAGNAWRGQFRIERFIHLHEHAQWTIQGALSEPIASVISSDLRQLSEDNGWPNVEGRIALGLGPLEAVGLEAKRPFEVGLSGVVGQVRTTTTPSAPTRVVADVWGVGADIRWKMTECIGISGETYTGKTLGTYNGAVLQNVNTMNFEGIRSSGAWGEVFVYWNPCLHSHFGYGIDDPDDDDLSPNPASFQRERNETTFANLIWDVNQAFRIGFEVTYRETDNTSELDNHGMGYHTQVMWSF